MIVANKKVPAAGGSWGRGSWWSCFYRWQNEPSVTKDFNGCIQLMKNYVSKRASSATLAPGVAGLDGLAADPLIPDRPTLAATGPTNFPLNRLTFRSSA